MRSRRGKVVAWSSVTLGLVVLAVCGFVFRDVIVEEWFIYRLNSGDEDERRAAVEKLGEMRSVRAVPHIIRSLARRRPLAGSVGGGASLFEVYSVPDLLESDDGRQAEALVRFVSESVGARESLSGHHMEMSNSHLFVDHKRYAHKLIQEVLKDLRMVRRVLRKIGTEAIPELKKLWKAEDVEQRVRDLAFLEWHALESQSPTRQ